MRLWSKEKKVIIKRLVFENAGMNTLREFNLLRALANKIDKKCSLLGMPGVAY